MRRRFLKIYTESWAVEFRGRDGRLSSEPSGIRG